MRKLWRIVFAGVVLGLLASQAALAGETGEIHEVEVVGEGTDEESALQAAFVKALQTTIGAVVHTQTRVRNYELTDDLLRVLTNGCIESYEELLSQSQNGVTRVAIRARVRRGIVADFLGVQRPKHRVELKDEWARLSTTARGREQAVQMLRSLVLGISPKLYKVTLIDLQSGEEIGSGGNPLPFLEQGKDSIVYATWAALITPDLDFWDNEASPLIDQCLQTLSERSGDLYIRMESERPEIGFYEGAPDGFAGNFTTAPLRRWQRILPHGPLPWENAAPVPVVHSAPHRIALQRNSKDAGGTRLSIYHLRPEAFSPLVAESARLDNVPLYLRAKLQLESGAEATFLVGQASPTLAPIGLPWSGAADALYFGPLFPVGWMTGGWMPKSAWPRWEGAILPMRTVPSFDSFLVSNGMIQRGDGSYMDALEKLIRVQRGARYKDAPARFEFDTGIVVPITFRMQIDDLKKVKGLAVDIIADHQDLKAQLDHFAKKDSKVCSAIKK
jgi:hypothetical protein